MLRRAALLPALLLAALVAQAGDTDPQSLYEYRGAVFGSMSKHMKSLGMMVKGEVPIRQKDLVAHATGLHAMSEVVPHLFPEGTGPEVVTETEALPSIWSDAEGFAAKATTFEEESAKLLEMAKAGDTDGFKGQFGKVGRSCGGCHDDFRKDDD